MSHNNILLTGFERFGNHESNPSQLVVKDLISEGYQGIILPTEYKAADELLNDKYLFGHGISTIVSFGLAADRNQISLEKFAYNEINPKAKDNAGYIPPSLLISNLGKNMIATSYNINPCLDAVRKEGIPCEISFDPGRYLCNYVYYKSLMFTAGAALFIHLPSEQGDWTIHKMTKAAETILEALGLA